MTYIFQLLHILFMKPCETPTLEFCHIESQPTTLGMLSQLAVIEAWSLLWYDSASRYTIHLVAMLYIYIYICMLSLIQLFDNLRCWWTCMFMFVSYCKWFRWLAGKLMWLGVVVQSVCLLCCEAGCTRRIQNKWFTEQQNTIPLI